MAGIRDANEVLAVSGRFYSAVNRILAGDPDPMLALWSRADDATYVDPRGGLHQGWEAIRAYWEGAAAANRDATARLAAAARLASLVVGGDLAYTVGAEEVWTAGEGDAAPRWARATNVYRREAGEWRMLHRHAEPLREAE